MRTSCRCLAFAALSALAVFPLIAGDDLATSPSVEFALYTASPFILSSRSAVDAFAAHSVTYRAGETVTATAPDDTVRTLVENAASSGSVAFAPTMDGLWRIDNSNGSVVFVGVDWGVFGGGWSHDFGVDSPFRMFTKGEGPNRKGLSRLFPDVTYSGDHWRGNDAAAVSLTFIAPDGQTTPLDLTGTGSLSFRFNQSGRWNVLLTMADGTTHEAEIYVLTGFTISIR